MNGKATSRTDKISPEFAARLGRLAPGTKVDAIILVTGAASAGKVHGERGSRVERQSTVDKKRRAAEHALPEIDTILRRYGGRRLADGANALGSIPVETTAAGIKALAASRHVRLILENQAVSLLRS